MKGILLISLHYFHREKIYQCYLKYLKHNVDGGKPVVRINTNGLDCHLMKSYFCVLEDKR